MSDTSPDSTPAPQPDDKGAGYVVVARRYRPRDFDELVGQQHVGQALRNAIETNRVGHAYLFTGARGVGKTSTARIFAKALNCPSGPNASPDQNSDISKAIDSGEDVDVIEIDGASNRGIDEIRSLRANAGVRPSRSRFKIYIIDEVHMLTTPAFNALLKTLEEPPAHVKFIFCTTDPEKIPITVLSRCQRFDFAPVELQEIVARLQFIVESEQAQADEAALELIARRAAGSMRDSQSLLEQVLSFSSGKLTADNVHSMLGTANDDRLHQLAQALSDRDAAGSLKLMDAAIDEGVDAGKLAEQLLGFFRDLMAVTVGCDASMLRHASASMHASLLDLGNRWGLQTVLAVVGLIDQTLVRTRHSVYARVLLEATLIQICHLPDLQHIANLAEASGGMPNGSRTKSQAVQKKKGDLIKSGTATPSKSTAASLDRSDNDGNTNPPDQVERPEIGRTQEKSVATAEPVIPLKKSTPEIPNADTLEAVASAKSESQVAVEEPTGNQESSDALESTDHSSQKSTERVAWNASNSQRVWNTTVARLESMTESLARLVERFEYTSPRSAKLHLPHDSNLAKRRLESTEPREAITAALKQVTGDHITFEVILGSKPVQKNVPTAQPAKPSRMQRMREIENNPLIKECLALFDAEIIGIEKPR